MGTGHAAREWPLTKGACFSAGNSVFEVEDLDDGSGGASEGKDAKDGPREPLLHLRARTGPKKGALIGVGRVGLTLGRANDNTVTTGGRG